MIFSVSFHGLMGTGTIYFIIKETINAELWLNPFISLILSWCTY